MFLYQVINNQEIVILGYRGYNGFVIIPQKIQDMPVTGLSAYAFSGGWGRDQVMELMEQEMRYCDEEGNPIWPDLEKLPPAVSCETLKEIYLPSSIKKIGNYAFYNCYELLRIECFSSIEDLGSGLFTGCTGVRTLDIHMVDGPRSCLKVILSELRQELYVNYYTGHGKARLLFPEMFEESVEHTPARIIIREMHGCGHMYRYCFDLAEFQFHKYDGLFPHLQIQESERVIASLVVNRLYTPLQLLEHDKEIYEAYVKDHMESIAKQALKEDLDMFYWFAGEYGENQEVFDSMVDMAAKRDNPELSGRLMDLRRRRFPARKRVFSL